MGGGLGRAGPVWLDVTRLVSRAGRGVLTGIDRVELAYLDHLLSCGGPHDRFLLRSTRGYLLLDRRGGAELSAVMHGTTPVPARADIWSRLLGKGASPRHGLEAALRRLAVDRALATRLGRMVAHRAGDAPVYLNVGHSNLSAATLGAVSAPAGARVAVLIHDVIPISHPDLVADGMPERFAGRLERVRAHADLVICNSAGTRRALLDIWSAAAPHPPAIVAPLGLDPPPRSRRDRRPGSFVMLGTIEPRKNHAMMLEVWERLAGDLPADKMPDLHIIGPVGWKVEALMQRLRAHRLTGRHIHLHGPLPEAEMQAHLGRATALLFPSLVEGYGYPPLEAAAAGALPICSDLPVFRETLGDSAVYLGATDTYSWTTTIKKHVLGIAALPCPPTPRIPGWAEHFDIVGAALARHRAEGR